MLGASKVEQLEVEEDGLLARLEEIKDIKQSCLKHQKINASRDRTWEIFILTLLKKREGSMFSAEDFREFCNEVHAISVDGMPESSLEEALDDLFYREEVQVKERLEEINGQLLDDERRSLSTYYAPGGVA